MMHDQAQKKHCPSCNGTSVGTNGVCAECGAVAFDPRIGCVLDGKYRVDSLIGAGGMGKVYRGTHLSLAEPVAVKFLLKMFSEMPELRARFRREAQLLAKVRHPGVVSVIDFGELEGELYLVMELVSGGSLADLVTGSASPQLLPRIGGIFDQLLQVLVAVHDVGVIHRDLKPDNVMLVERHGRLDHIKLLDFGLARMPQTREGPRLTEVGAVQGTPHYMSPEQCRGEDVGPESDVYSVGCMLFEALAGAPPFDGAETAGLLAQHMFVEPPAISSVGHKRIDVPTGLEKVVRKALSKSPTSRYTALEFRDALSAALGGTDADSMLKQASDERVRAAGLSREDRALTGLRHESSPKLPEEEPEASRVVLWMPSGGAGTEIRTALSVAGLRVTLLEEPEDPPLEIRGEPVRAYVVSAAFDGAARLTRLRQLSKDALVLCVDAEGARDIAELVRSGASDATLKGAATGDITRRMKRILKRGR